MKSFFLPALLAFSLSLSLAACQTPSSQSDTPDSHTLPATSVPPTSLPALLKSPANGSLRLQNNTLTLTLNLPELPDTSNFKTQKLDLSTTTKLFAQVSDSHGKTYAPNGADGDGAVNYTSGTIILTFNNITPDELLFVEIQAKNGTTPIPQADLATVIKHTTDASPVNTTLNFQTSVAAKALKTLLASNATRTRTIDLPQLNALTAAITGVTGTAPNLIYSQNHPTLVNTTLLATHLQSQAPNSLNATNYRQNGATLPITVSGLTNGDNIQVQLTDAASAIKANLGNGNSSITGATPGNGLRALVTPTGSPSQTYSYSFSSNLNLSAGSNPTLTIVATPTLQVTHLSPTAGPPGTVVTITGSGFMGATAVAFNGSPATSFTVNSDTQITATVPLSGTDGTISVTKAGTTKYSTDFDVHRIIFVKANAVGSNTGQSWTDAYPNLQTALNISQPNDDIWIAAGTYKPTEANGLRTETFLIKDNVQVYGGFAGHETHVSQRSHVNNRVILTGDLNGDDDYNSSPFGNISENSLVVVSMDNGGRNIVLDSLTIAGGHNNSSGAPYYNTGAGLRNIRAYNGNSAEFELNHVIITHNTASEGAGIYALGPGINFHIKNSFFIKNLGGSYGGGLLIHYGALAHIDNTVFAENTGTRGGDICLRVSDAHAELNNVTFSHSTPTSSIEDYGVPGNVTVKNLLFWNSTILSDNHNWTANGGTTAISNPFVNVSSPFGNDGLPFTTDDGLRISPSATSILSAGTNTGAPTTDILGNPRPGAGNTNAEPGAYEYTP